MRPRRVLLCLPEQPSELLLEVAREVRAVLSRTRSVRLRLGDNDDDVTPIEAPQHQPLIIRIEEPPDGGEGLP